MEYAKEPPLVITEGQAASASLRQLMTQRIKFHTHPDLSDTASHHSNGTRG